MRRLSVAVGIVAVLLLDTAVLLHLQGGGTVPVGSTTSLPADPASIGASSPGAGRAAVSPLLVAEGLGALTPAGGPSLGTLRRSPAPGTSPGPDASVPSATTRPTRSTGSTGDAFLSLTQPGVLIGAYPRIRGASGSDQAQTLAFEHQQGRRLDIDHHYTAFGTPMPAVYPWDIQQGRTPMMSWAGADTDAIAAGTWDSTIVARAREIRALQAPFLVRFMWEMNGAPHEAHFVRSAPSFIAAWRRVVTIFRAQGATNAQFVWCPTADGFRPGGPAGSFYPGDNFVDIVGADGFNWSPGRGGPWRSFQQVFADFTAWAHTHVPDKPLLIGEMGVQEGAPGAKAAWLQAMATTLRTVDTQIKAIVYFNSAPKYPWWLDSSPSSLQAWRSVVDQSFFDTRRAPAA